MRTTTFLLASLACVLGLLSDGLAVGQDQIPALVSWASAAGNMRDCTMTALTALILFRGGAGG